ncbi:DNA glycosylase AlkZ-like family protein [Geodermatophilus sp. SYSU D01105]
MRHLVGLQAQEPQGPWLGLLARLDGVDLTAAGQLLEERRLVRTHLMRRTVHLVTAEDCLALRPSRRCATWPAPTTSTPRPTGSSPPSRPREPRGASSGTAPRDHPWPRSGGPPGGRGSRRTISPSSTSPVGRKPSPS